MANNRLAVYDCQAVQLIIATIPIKEGLVKGTFLKFAPADENFGYVQDVNGLVTRYRKNNRIYMMEVTVHQSSVHNTQFSAIFGADHLATDGSGISSGLIKDDNGSTLCTIPHMWISKPPDAEWGEEVKEWTWTFTCVTDANLVILGGN